MRRSNFSTVLLLVSALALPGCRNSHASPSASSSAASLAKPSAVPSSAKSFAHPSKHPPRDSELAVYHNPDYGISFRYPRNYVLLEAKQNPKLEPQPDPAQGQDQAPEQESIDSADSGSLLTQQSLEAGQPGAHLVATILIPDDAYPNTTFAGGHLQFAVNPLATAESCRALVTPPSSSSPAAPHDLFLQDIHFLWRDRSSVSPGILSAGREYTGFSGGACYEFFILAVSTPSSDSVPPAAPADLARILRPLEKSVSSLQVHPVSRPQ
jgi:hypothetical protein